MNRMGKPCIIDERKRIVIPDEVMKEKKLKIGDSVIFEWIDKNSVKITFSKTVKI